MTALAMLARYWREAAIAALLVALALAVAIDGGRIARCKAKTADAVAALDRTKRDYALAQSQAHAANVEQVRAVEQRQAAITEEVQDDLTNRLAAARAAGAAYAARLRQPTEAVGGPARGADVPAGADPAGSAADANRATLLDADVRICSENTVIAQGWQDWYGRAFAR